MFPGDIAASVTNRNFAYSLLAINWGGKRSDEWRDTGNSDAVVMSDRWIKDQTTGNFRSVHTDPGSGNDWKGSLCWNDNHVDYEPSETVDTVYSSEARKVIVSDDNVFQKNNGYNNQSSSTVSEADAVMVFRDSSDITDGAAG